MTDRKYETARNKLLGIAAHYADSQAKNAMLNARNKTKWTIAFIHEMDRLAVEAGLQKVRFHT